MTLPIDITTCLWFTYEPVWVREPDPEADAPLAAAQATAAANSTSFDPPAEGAGSGYRLVLQGLRLTTSVQWLFADSPQSRPWLRVDLEPASAARRRDRRHDEAHAEPATGTALRPTVVRSSASHGNDPSWEAHQLAAQRRAD